MFEAIPQQSTAVLVEMVLGRHRITGEVRLSGAPRRLLDMLNGIEGNFLQVHDGRLEDLMREGEEPHTFGLAQVHLDSILFATPRSEAPERGDSFDVVQKIPIEAVVIVPGFDISGRAFVLADGQRSEGPILGTRRFAPLADATIISADDRSRVWREPILVVNLARAVLCLPPGVEA
ncbi:MAG: hypothetical protein Q7T33_16005 [Dehalococcoidia bacterium]|nr:hypothetical protein [Dehalococcoidia bacterium]